MAMKRYPGFIDVHVHLREPGATHKEDFVTGSRAAIAGGFTCILDMPNNPTPTFSQEALAEKITLSQKKALCDIGFHYGTNGKNIDSFSKIWNNSHVFGLKLYCNHTTGEYLIEDPLLIEQVFAAWKSDKPILVHAEGEMLERVISVAKKYARRLHVCHISLAQEVMMVREAKKKNQPITAGVTPHHLFLTNTDVQTLGSLAMMKPALATHQDQDALWQGVADGTIDIVETDHAPHTKEEKQSDKPPFGVPGLETAVGLLFRAVHEGKLTETQVISLVYDHPKKIFHIPDQKDTYIELDSTKPYTIGDNGYETKCEWSPFDGWEAYGKVQTVILRGRPRIQKGVFV